MTREQCEKSIGRRVAVYDFGMRWVSTIVEVVEGDDLGHCVKIERDFCLYRPSQLRLIKVKNIN
jgi:hypothetical protein